MLNSTTASYVFASLLLSGPANLTWAQAPQPNGAGLEAGTLPLSWVASGPRCMEVPDWQVHEYNPNFYIIRQSGCLDYEKPFLYLIFGRERGLLLDTGSRNFPAAEMLQNVAGKWLKRIGRVNVEIVVVHSHAHSDHVAGDEQLRILKSPNLTVKLIPATVDATKELYGITTWPDQFGKIDLGSRILDAIPIPGHSTTSLALYDRQTGILLTGDSLYPGRLYVHDWNAFVKSTRRLVVFTQDKLIAHILGCHVEQSRTPYLDYPVGTIYQPDEHALALSRGNLIELSNALASLPVPTRLALRDFSIWPQVTDSQQSAAAENEFKTTEKYQLKHMWNQMFAP